MAGPGPQQRRRYLAYSDSQADDVEHQVDRVMQELAGVRDEINRLRELARRRDGLLMALLQECRALNERMKRFEN